MLKMVVENLAENAIRYAGTGSTFTWRLARMAATWSLPLLTTVLGSIRTTCLVSSSAFYRVIARGPRVGAARPCHREACRNVRRRVNRGSRDTGAWPHRQMSIPQVILVHHMFTSR